MVWRWMRMVSVQPRRSRQTNQPSPESVYHFGLLSFVSRVEASRTSRRFMVRRGSESITDHQHRPRVANATPNYHVRSHCRSSFFDVPAPMRDQEIPQGVTFGAKRIQTDEIRCVGGLTSGLTGPWRLYLGVVSTLLFDVIES